MLGRAVAGVMASIKTAAGLTDRRITRFWSEVCAVARFIITFFQRVSADAPKPPLPLPVHLRLLRGSSPPLTAYLLSVTPGAASASCEASWRQPKAS